LHRRGRRLRLFGFHLGPNTASAGAGLRPGAAHRIRILFGEKQERETDYSGSLTLSQGTIAELIPWRFFGDDRIESTSEWTLVTRRAALEDQPDQPRPISTSGNSLNIVPKAVSSSARLRPLDGGCSPPGPDGQTTDASDFGLAVSQFYGCLIPIPQSYNNLRLNSATGYITPKDMLAGRQQEIHAERDRKLEQARKQRQIRRKQAA